MQPLVFFHSTSRDWEMEQRFRRFILRGKLSGFCFEVFPEHSTVIGPLWDPASGKTSYDKVALPFTVPEVAPAPDALELAHPDAFYEIQKVLYDRMILVPKRPGIDTAVAEDEIRMTLRIASDHLRGQVSFEASPGHTDISIVAETRHFAPGVPAQWALHHILPVDALHGWGVPLDDGRYLVLREARFNAYQDRTPTAHQVAQFTRRLEDFIAENRP